jgi:hypothetical protein
VTIKELAEWLEFYARRTQTQDDFEYDSDSDASDSGFEDGRSAMAAEVLEKLNAIDMKNGGE